ncbi:MAG TPA: tetratricopeptide repeat protein [Tepidisphaeraceae bacterium]|nr:tetratricopeptide repeat protein [Tepidisphaeraceae bacterium]
MTVEEAMQIAIAHQRAGRRADAENVYRQILAQNPNHTEALSQLAQIANEAGQTQLAVDLMHRAVEINPFVAAYHYLLGNFQRGQGDFSAAMTSYCSAIKLKANYIEAYNNLGVTLAEKGLIDDAIGMFKRAIEHAPNNAQLLANLALTFNRADWLDEAIDACKKSLAINPKDAAAHNTMGLMYRKLGRLDEAMAEFSIAMNLPGDAKAAGRYFINTLLYHAGYNADQILQGHRQWAERYAEPLARHIQPHANDRSAGRPLRIGYVSGDLRRHSVAYFLLPLLQNHDRGQFHVTCYSAGAWTDTVTEDLKKHCDQWVSLLGMPDERAAAEIRRDKVDILVDLAGHSGDRMQLFALKPAPVQVAWLGYAATTGLSTMDWRLTDAQADPDGAERQYTEKLFRLPHTAWCFEPLSGTPPIQPVRRSNIVFGCFNEMSKLNPPLLRTWAKILDQVPGSRLLLKNRVSETKVAQAQIRAEFSAPDRLDLIPPTVSPLEHLQCYNQMDIALDTFPFHGTTTTCEALWMGVPVISRLGGAHAGRVGASLLHAVGLDDLVALDENAYVRISVSLAADSSRRNELRASLRQHMRNSALMDGASFARDVETAYRAMWAQWINQ